MKTIKADAQHDRGVVVESLMLGSSWDPKRLARRYFVRLTAGGYCLFTCDDIEHDAIGVCVFWETGASCLGHEHVTRQRSLVVSVGIHCTIEKLPYLGRHLLNAFYLDAVVGFFKAACDLMVFANATERTLKDFIATLTQNLDQTLLVKIGLEQYVADVKMVGSDRTMFPKGFRYFRWHLFHILPPC